MVIAGLMAAVLILFGYGHITYQNHHLICTMYAVDADISESLRIVHLSDLHSWEFGRDNDDLAEMVRLQQPDMIFLTGDMLNQDDDDPQVVLKLVERLAETAPVYYGYGNHEIAWEENHGIALREFLTQSGAIVLNNDYIDITVKGQPMRIGGYMGYYRQPHMMTQDDAQKVLEYAFFDDFENTDRLKLLLNHIPTGWTDWGYLDRFPVDLIFSGHYHGGLVRLPLWNRGLYAPYIGLFPPYTKGVYTGEKATAILSTGLGSDHMIPRINNPPEIVVVDLVPVEK